MLFISLNTIIYILFKNTFNTMNKNNSANNNTATMHNENVENVNDEYDSDIDFESFVSLDSLLNRQQSKDDSNTNTNDNDNNILSQVVVKTEEENSANTMERIASDDNSDTVYATDSVNKIPKSELYVINYTISELEESMSNYLTDAKYMWENNIAPFLNSSDCYTLENLKDDDFMTFLKFMMEQRVYKLMLVSHKRLIARRKVLTTTNN
jgi:seryl-tRNA synthetase